MGEISIDPKFNIHETYKKVRILNPYRNAGSSLQPETTAYISRVEADGGEVINPTYVNEAFSLLKGKGILDTDYSWLSASFGLIKDVNDNVSKLYSLKGAQWDLIGQEILSATWKATGSQTSMPVITMDKDRAVAFKPSVTTNLAQPNTMFSVHSTVYVESNQYIYDGTSYGGRSTLFRQDNEYKAGTSDFATTTIGADANTHIIQVNFQGSTSSMYVDDITALNSVDLGTRSFGYMTLGNFLSVANTFALGGDWSEFLVLDGGISAADIEIRELLNGKYNTYT